MSFRPGWLLRLWQVPPAPLVLPPPAPLRLRRHRPLLCQHHPSACGAEAGAGLHTGLILAGEGPKAEGG